MSGEIKAISACSVRQRCGTIMEQPLVSTLSMIQEPPVKPDTARKPLSRLREIERKVPRTIVRIEKKIVSFPFQKYFIGHAKPQPPAFKPDWRLWSDERLTLA